MSPFKTNCVEVNDGCHPSDMDGFAFMQMPAYVYPVKIRDI